VVAIGRREVVSLYRRRGLELPTGAPHALRIAVKDAETNRGIVQVLAEALQPS
jgi:histidinol-phosphate/aromatic aminotransferase/cobyric acid decarboxylase-like protein